MNESRSCLIRFGLYGIHRKFSGRFEQAIFVKLSSELWIRFTHVLMYPYKNFHLILFHNLLCIWNIFGPKIWHVAREGALIKPNPIIVKDLTWSQIFIFRFVLQTDLPNIWQSRFLITCVIKVALQSHVYMHNRRNVSLRRRDGQPQGYLTTILIFKYQGRTNTYFTKLHCYNYI